MEKVKCNICNIDDTTLWAVKDNITIVKCKKCGLIYCNPRLDNNELKEFYKEDYFIEGDYEENKLRHQMYEVEIREILKNIGQRGRFLDVGCAVGKFLKILPDTFEKWGTEFSADASKIGREKYGLNIITGEIRNIDLPENYFDIIQLRGVIEHSQNPYEDLSKINKLLKDSGTLRISQLPNIRSLCAFFYKERFNQVKPREHIYYFSLKTMKKLLAATGFKITKVMYPYFKTPYASPVKDFFNLFSYLFDKTKESPPFYGNMIILYAKKNEKNI